MLKENRWTIGLVVFLTSISFSPAWGEHNKFVEATQVDRPQLYAATCPTRNSLDRYLEFFDRLMQDVKVLQEKADQSKAKELEAKIEELAKLNAGLEAKLKEAKRCERDLIQDLHVEKSSVEFYQREQIKQSIMLVQLAKSSKAKGLTTKEFFTDLKKAVDVGYWSNPGMPSLKSQKSAQAVLNKYPAWWVLETLRDQVQLSCPTDSTELENFLRAFYLYNSAFRQSDARANEGGPTYMDWYFHLPVHLKAARYQGAYEEALGYQDALVAQCKAIRPAIFSKKSTKNPNIVVAIDDPIVHLGHGLIGSGWMVNRTDIPPERVIGFAQVFPGQRKTEVEIKLQNGKGSLKTNDWDEKAPILKLPLPKAQDIEPSGPGPETLR